MFEVISANMFRKYNFYSFGKYNCNMLANCKSYLFVKIKCFNSLEIQFAKHLNVSKHEKTKTTQLYGF